jgi:protein phosphatase
MSDTLTDPNRTPVYTPQPVVPAAGESLVVDSYGLSHVGRVREANEDCFLIADLRKMLRVRHSNLPQTSVQHGDEKGHLFVVADGMGGHQAGERASALTVEVLERYVLNVFKWFFALRGPEEQAVLAEFQTAIRLADDRVREEGAEHPELSGMGTTLTVAYVLYRDLYVAHVGDSRCYLLRGGQLHRLTRDHTLAAEMMRHGMLSPEEAARHHLRHAVTNVVGGIQPGVRVEVQKTSLEAGDVVLLCSDGLTEMLSDERLRAVLTEEPAPHRACERLIDEANAAGGKDNITAVVARFAAPE